MADPTPDPLTTIAQTGTAAAYRAEREGPPPTDLDRPVAPPTEPAAPPQAASPPLSAPASAGPTAGAGGAGVDEDAEAPPTTVATFKKRLAAERRRRGEIERQLEAERAAFRARLESPPPRATPEAQAADPRAATAETEPQPSDFETYEQYVRAQAQVEARQAIRAELETRAQHARQLRQAQTIERIYQTARRAHPDLDQLIEDAAEALHGRSFSPLVTEVLIEHPRGPEIVYALLKDPALLVRLNGIRHPMVFGTALAEHVLLRLGAASGAPPTPPPLTTAAPPISPVGTQATASLPTLEQVAHDSRRYRQLREGGRG